MTSQALDPALVDFVRALARANAARDIERARKKARSDEERFDLLSSPASD
jgi:hypothetical protein